MTEVALLSDANRRGLRPGDRLLTPRDALQGDLGSTVTMPVERCDGRTRELDVRRERAFWPPERPGFRWHVVRGSSDSRIGYLRIDRFDDGTAEPAVTLLARPYLEAAFRIIDAAN